MKKAAKLAGPVGGEGGGGLSAPAERAISFTVPLVPPSVNHYVKHTRRGSHYVTKEAQAFKDAVILCARGRRVIAKQYGVELGIYLGANQKGDIDNYSKVVLDGLKDADVIHSDAAVTYLAMFKSRDVDLPRTEIKVWSRA